MNYAAATVQIAFDDFYGRLRNEQKCALIRWRADRYMPNVTAVVLLAFRLR